MADSASVQLARVEATSLPEAQKTALRRWYEAKGATSRLAQAKTHIISAGHTVRSGAEGALVGAVLGAASVALPGGLDMPVPGQAAGGAIPAVPLDAALGVVSALGSVWLADHTVATDLRNVATASFAVAAYRATERYARTQQTKSPSAHGDFGNEKKEDPILAAAHAL